MKEIIFGCSVTDKSSSGNYNYYLYSRIDNYAVILREKTDGTEWKFKVIVPSEDIATIWAAATSQTYQRPDEFVVGVKKYIINALDQYLRANKNIAKNW